MKKLRANIDVLDATLLGYLEKEWSWWNWKEKEANVAVSKQTLEWNFRKNDLEGEKKDSEEFVRMFKAIHQESIRSSRQSA
jgi:hypothetical protein